MAVDAPAAPKLTLEMDAQHGGVESKALAPSGPCYLTPCVGVNIWAICNSSGEECSGKWVLHQCPRGGNGWDENDATFDYGEVAGTERCPNPECGVYVTGLNFCFIGCNWRLKYKKSGPDEVRFRPEKGFFKTSRSEYGQIKGCPGIPINYSSFKVQIEQWN